MNTDRAAAPPPGELSPEEFAAWAGFMQTHATVTRGLDADLRVTHGLTLSDSQLLFWLSHEACAPMRPAELAGAVMLSPSGLSRAIERLEARGLVRRQRSDDVRRSAFVVPTASGAELLRRATATQTAGIPPPPGRACWRATSRTASGACASSGVACPRAADYTMETGDRADG